MERRMPDRARGWFVDLTALRCAPYRGPKGGIVFNSAGFRREAVVPLRFREDLERASDTRWMRELATLRTRQSHAPRAGRYVLLVVPSPQPQQSGDEKAFS